MADSAQYRIQSLLDRIAVERGIRILYTCESGSQAWGFASSDSDYDIRFVFAHPEKAYERALARMAGTQRHPSRRMRPHRRGYDSKNLMHTIRLLEMAGEIAREGVLHVRRPNREFLLEVRAGAFDYDTLVARAEELHSGLESAFATSGLPNAPDRDHVNALLVELREEFRSH